MDNEITQFPHAILEVKIELGGTTTEPPEWVTKLMNSGMLSGKCRRYRCCPQLVLTTCLRVFPSCRPNAADVLATSCNISFFSVLYVVSLSNCRHVVAVTTTTYHTHPTPCVSNLLYPSSLSQHNHHNCSANFPPAPAAAIKHQTQYLLFSQWVKG